MPIRTVKRKNIISHITPVGGNVFLDLGFLPDQAREMLEASNREIQQKLLAKAQALQANQPVQTNEFPHGENLSTLGLNVRASLLQLAHAILNDSTAQEAQDFNIGEWLEVWLKTPQPSLGGARPNDMLATPSGVAAVKRLLGAISSGAYQ